MSTVTIYRVRQRMQISGTSTITDSGVKFAIDSAVDEVANLTGVSVTSGSPQGFEPAITNFAAYFSMLGIATQATKDGVGYRLGRLALFKRDRVQGLIDIANAYYIAGKEALERGMAAPITTRILWSGTKSSAEGAENPKDADGAS